LKIKSNKKIDFKLYLITDRKLLTDNCSLLTAVKQALKGGVRAIQLREKDLGTRELLDLAYGLSGITRQYKARLFINDRFDIALASGADGVHLTQNSIPADAVRKAVRNRLMIGVSTHSLKEAETAGKAGADFITLGPVFRTPSKLKYGKPLGIDTLNEISKKIKIPVFAIGGIKTGRIRAVKEAGAYGAAMISEIFRSGDIQKKARKITQLLEYG
jgi:thiamine-phosphate pyrophosphorylase